MIARRIGHADLSGRAIRAVTARGQASGRAEPHQIARAYLSGVALRVGPATTHALRRAENLAFADFARWTVRVLAATRNTRGRLEEHRRCAHSARRTLGVRAAAGRACAHDAADLSARTVAVRAGRGAVAHQATDLSGRAVSVRATAGRALAQNAADLPIRAVGVRLALGRQDVATRSERRGHRYRKRQPVEPHANRSCMTHAWLNHCFLGSSPHTGRVRHSHLLQLAHTGDVV